MMKAETKKGVSLMKKKKLSLILSSSLLTLLGAPAILLCIIQLGYWSSAYDGFFLPIILTFGLSMWWVLAFIAGVLGLLSLKWHKLGNAGMLLGLLFAVRCAVEAAGSIGYWSSFAICLLRLALAVWFFLSALFAEDSKKPASPDQAPPED